MKRVAYKKKLVVETIFFHFLKQQSTVASGNSFSSTGTYFSTNPSFQPAKMSFLSTGNIIFLFQVFFLLMENITEIWGKSNFKDVPYSCCWTPTFFDFFRYFLKYKPYFCIAEAYFSISFILLIQTDFLLTKTPFGGYFAAIRNPFLILIKR